MIARLLGGFVVCGLVASVSLQAHHSLAGVYDMRKEGEMKGGITKANTGLKVGDTITVKYFPSRKGSLGFLKSVTPEAGGTASIPGAVPFMPP